MQRRANYHSSEFALKTGLAYEVAVGYNVYNPSYDISMDKLTDSDWNREVPVFSGDSASMYFYWWDLDGAAGMLSSTVAAVALLNLF